MHPLRRHQGPDTGCLVLCEIGDVLKEDVDIPTLNLTFLGTGGACEADWPCFDFEEAVEAAVAC